MGHGKDFGNLEMTPQQIEKVQQQVEKNKCFVVWQPENGIKWS